MTTKTYDIPDQIIEDLVNATIMLRTMSQHYPHLDHMGQINIDIAADAMQALTDLANVQHPVPLPTPQVIVIERQAVGR